MLPDVFAVLNTVAVRAIVDTRIYRHGMAPQGVIAPYVTWFVVTGVPEIHLDGTPPIDNVSVQVDGWTNSDGTGIAQAAALGIALRDAIEASHDITNFGNDSQDFQTQRYRISLTFTFWNPR